MKGLDGIEITKFTNGRAEPSVEVVEDAVKTFANKKIDCIIDLGGGSVIDFSKSVAIKLSDHKKNLREISPIETIRISVPLIEILTTGSGSDVSFATVLIDIDRKFPTGNYVLVPMIYILDSSVSARDPNIMKNSGIDAAVMTIESIISNICNLFTDPIAKEAPLVIFNKLKEAMGGNDEEIEAVQLAMSMSDMAFSNTDSIRRKAF